MRVIHFNFPELDLSYLVYFGINLMINNECR